MVVVGLALACFGDAAYAQGPHSGTHSGGASSSEFMGGIEHGVALAATVLLAGLAPFAALVWLPVSKGTGAGRDAVRPFGLLAWILLYVLLIAVVCELSAYATLASGESLSLGILRETLIETRVGRVWLARLAFGLPTAVLVTVATRSGRTTARGSPARSPSWVWPACARSRQPWTPRASSTPESWFAECVR
jgi:hypothetical protein